MFLVKSKKKKNSPRLKNMSAAKNNGKLTMRMRLQDAAIKKWECSA